MVFRLNKYNCCLPPKQYNNQLAKKRNELESMYTDDQSYMVDILMQQYEAQQDALDIMNNALKAGMDSKEEKQIFFLLMDIDYRESINEKK